MEPRLALKWAKDKLLPKAKNLAKDPKKLLALVKDVEEKLKKGGFKEQFKAFWSDLKTMLALLVATAKGEYKPRSKKDILLIILALVYFLNPFDLIPDLLVGGFIDDAALIAWIINRVSKEIQHFKGEA